MPRPTRAQLVGIGAGTVLALGLAVIVGLVLLYVVASTLASG